MVALLPAPSQVCWFAARLSQVNLNVSGAGQWRNRRCGGGGDAGGRVPPQRLLTGKFLLRKKRQGKKGKGVKIEKKRWKKLKMEGGKGTKWGEAPLFCFSFCFWGCVRVFWFALFCFVLVWFHFFFFFLLLTFQNHCYAPGGVCVCGGGGGVSMGCSVFW